MPSKKVLDGAHFVSNMATIQNENTNQLLLSITMLQVGNGGEVHNLEQSIFTFFFSLFFLESNKLHCQKKWS